MCNSEVKCVDILKKQTGKKVPCTKLPIHDFTHHLKTSDGSKDRASHQQVEHMMGENKMLLPNLASFHYILTSSHIEEVVKYFLPSFHKRCPSSQIWRNIADHQLVSQTVTEYIHKLLLSLTILF